MQPSPVLQSAVPPHADKAYTSPKTEFLGMVHHIQEVFPGKTLPSYLRGAMQGEGVVATYSENAAYNPEHERAMSLMSRLTSPAIAERKGHLEFTDPTINKKVTGDEINNFRIPIHDIR